MSYAWQDKAWKLSLDSSSKMVILALAYRANEDGECWPSLAGIAELTGLNVKTVKTVLPSLVARGLIVKQASKGVKNKYTLVRSAFDLDQIVPSPKTDQAQIWVDPKTDQVPSPNLPQVPSPKLGYEHINNKSYNKSNTYMAEIDEEKDPFAPLGEQIEDAQAERVIDIQDDPDHVLSANEMRNLARVNLVSLNCTERLKACAERKTITVSLFNECVKEYKKVPRSTGYLVGILDRVSRDPKQMQDKIRKEAATRGFLADCGLDVDDGIPF